MNKKWLLVPLLIILITGIFVYQNRLTNSDSKLDEFELNNLNDEKISLNDQKGIIILDFMATWCQPCREQIKELKAINNEYKEKITIISISTEERTTIENFKKEYNITWDILLDQDGQTFKDYQVNQIPTLYIIDQDNNLIKNHVGIIKYEELRDLIEDEIN